MLTSIGGEDERDESEGMAVTLLKSSKISMPRQPETRERRCTELIAVNIFLMFPVSVFALLWDFRTWTSMGQYVIVFLRYLAIGVVR